MIDTFNAMQRHVAQRHGVGYIETFDIVGPIWDQASDWGHPELAFPIIAKRILERLNQRGEGPERIGMHGALKGR